MKIVHNETGNIIEATQDFLDAHPEEYSLFSQSSLTLDELKTKKIKKLHDNYQSFFDDYLARYPKSEVASFEDKKAEALAYMIDNTSPTPVIDSIITGYGGDKEEYINSVVAKVQYLAQAEGAMVAKRDAIKACTTEDELEAIAI